jgi:hypothetical protein
MTVKGMNFKALPYFSRYNQFNILSISMQGNNTNITIVTDEVKKFIRKLGLWV